MSQAKMKLLNFYIDPKLLSELKKLSANTKIPQAIILREAVADKVAEYKARIKGGEKVELGVVTR